MKAQCHPALPQPAAGGVWHRDYRQQNRPGAASRPARSADEPLRVLSWNIERGYKLDGIIDELVSADADIIALQEVDLGCKRSDNRDAGAEIARALRLNYLFVTEFRETYHGRRNTRSQGGGLHGHAILTRFDFVEGSVKALSHVHQAIDWSAPAHSLAKREPREGHRITLYAQLETPLGRVGVFNAHLECFTGVLGRVKQLSEIFAMARQEVAAGNTRVVLMGDLNTLGHGAARLSRYHCNDALRFGSLGLRESEWLAKHVLAVQDVPANRELLRLGFEDQVAEDAVNPGFVEVFDPATAHTLDYFGAGSLLTRLGLGMVGKLDWLMLRDLRAVGRSMGNADYKLSDHKWLMADVVVGASSHIGHEREALPPCTDQRWAARQDSDPGCEPLPPESSGREQDPLHHWGVDGTLNGTLIARAESLPGLVGESLSRSTSKQKGTGGDWRTRWLPRLPHWWGLNLGGKSHPPGLEDLDDALPPCWSIAATGSTHWKQMCSWRSPSKTKTLASRAAQD